MALSLLSVVIFLHVFTNVVFAALNDEYKISLPSLTTSPVKPPTPPTTPIKPPTTVPPVKPPTTLVTPTKPPVKPYPTPLVIPPRAPPVQPSTVKPPPTIPVKPPTRTPIKPPTPRTYKPPTTPVKPTPTPPVKPPPTPPVKPPATPVKPPTSPVQPPTYKPPTSPAKPPTTPPFKPPTPSVQPPAKPTPTAPVKPPRPPLLRTLIVTKRGAVATDDGRCSVIGKRILLGGGNAIDAAVAATLCLGVVSPASSGIGGGAFTLVKLASGEAIAYDSRETAPLLATEDMYGDNFELKRKGALSVGVPGEVAGLYTAWKRHGKIPWKELVNPAVKLATQGFTVSKYLYMQMNASKDGLLADIGLSELFVSNGELKKPGAIIRNPKLGLTLRLIAKLGPKAFYNGTIGRNLVEDIRKSGGIVSLKDLQSYKVQVKKPLSMEILGYRLLGMPPPSSGGAAMMLVLNMLSHYEIPSGVSGPLGAHRLVEALKHAFAVRMNLGDSKFVNVTEVVSDMLSTKFAYALKKKINDHKTYDPKYYGGKWNQINDHGTSHLSIIDGERNCVSMTSTINAYILDGKWRELLEHYYSIL